MEHLVLRRLPDQFIPRRVDQLGALLHHLPLSGRRQRNAQVGFQLFESVKRNSATILESRDHRGRRLIVLLRSHPFRSAP